MTEPNPQAETAKQRRARRARERQLAYQRAKAARARGHEAEYIAAMRQRSARVREKLERVRPIGDDARVLEVGSGAHGLVFFFGTTRCIGVDPLATEYAQLFPVWQQRVRTITAAGEDLPFADGAFDVVLCDNVVDHAEDPARIARELARVLARGGLLYFTVNVHHPVYAAAGRLRPPRHAGDRLKRIFFKNARYELVAEREA
jgi:SAM-dependent methyltransferase